MRVYVKQDKITFFGRKYIIYKNQIKLYIIQKLWFTPIPKYVITEYNSGKKIGTIQNKFFSFKGDAEITLPRGAYKFDQESINSMKYDCKSTKSPSKVYKLRGNKGFTGSIYEDNIQIGKWDKNQFVIFDGDAYELDLDFDSDILLIASMMVLVDTYRISITVGGDIGWELGNIGKDLEVNKSVWKPKENL